jgi:hypothetical protein
MADASGAPGWAAPCAALAPSRRAHACPPSAAPLPAQGGPSHTEAAIAHLRAELSTALEEAHRVCTLDGRSPKCAAAYDAVDEISAALARKKERLAEELGGAPGPDPFGASNPWGTQGGGGGGRAPPNGGSGLYPYRPPAQR